MKTFVAVVMGILLMGVMTVASNNYAFAGPHGPGHHSHHGFHHRGHWRFGPSVIVGGSTVFADEEECSMVKRCYINEFGKRRCRWEQVCE
jgi:hypothetical protein